MGWVGRGAGLDWLHWRFRATGVDDLFCGLMIDDVMASFYDTIWEEIEAISVLGRSIAGSYLSSLGYGFRRGSVIVKPIDVRSPIDLMNCDLICYI